VLVVVAYDVNTETKEGRRRLRRVARACQDFGQRVQKSVFECSLRDRVWVVLKSRLLSEFDVRTDSLRFYFLDETTRQLTQHYGVGRPVDFDSPLII
jgi:CRISPR-associated protein Cas2